MAGTARRPREEIALILAGLKHKLQLRKNTHSVRIQKFKKPNMKMGREGGDEEREKKKKHICCV